MPERVLVIGLDSASLPWLERWVSMGLMPNLAKFLRQSAYGILKSVNPPLSPAAWSSFATGMHPGKHGVFDHIYRRQGAYELAPTNSKLRAGLPVWQIISRHGGSAGVINVPETYPPEPLNGFMLSGMDTPSDDSDFSYPQQLKEELQQAVGGYQVFGMRSKESLDKSIQGMHKTIPMRVRAAKYLWDQYDPQFMVLVFMETDVIQHKCWKYMDPEHPEYNSRSAIAGRSAYADAIPNIYAKIDEALGPWLTELAKDTTVIVMSDHGAGPLNKFLHLNNWLAHQGYLRFKSTALARVKYAAFRLGFTPETIFNLASRLGLGIVDRATNKIKRDMADKERTTLLQQFFLSWGDVDWSQTKAYALGGNFTGFYLNLKGREPQGIVEPGQEYELLRDEIAHRLRSWTDPSTRQAIVQEVYRREELHDGPLVDRAPDVIFTTLNEAYVGFGGHEFASRQLMAASPVFNGHHRMDGMIAIAGPGIQPGRIHSHHIVDVSPTVLYRLGYPIPSNMDGEVIQQAFTTDYLAGRPVEIGEEALAEAALAGNGFNRAEEEALRSRLADLGYL